MNTSLSDILKGYAPISLAEMDGVSLMNRVDTKYILHETELLTILQQAEVYYRAAEIDGLRHSPYDTLYYDTTDLDMYIKHHNRRLVRRKVRVREYVSSGERFLEVKRKNNHGRTKKKRITLSSETQNATLETFVLDKSGYHWQDLQPALRVQFRRITLVDKQLTERLTIDTDLQYFNPRTGRAQDMNGLVIMELKQSLSSEISPIQRILLGVGIKPYKMSKYCIGTVLTAPDIKQNNFKKKIRKIERLWKNHYPLTHQ